MIAPMKSERLSYPEVEGLLYRMGGPSRNPEPLRAAQPVAPPQGRRTFGPRSPRLDEQAVDITFAFRGLDEGDRQIIREHYITGAQRHGYNRRQRVVERLRARLNQDWDGDR